MDTTSLKRRVHQGLKSGVFGDAGDLIDVSRTATRDRSTSWS